jgi:hypothetical protein
MNTATTGLTAAKARLPRAILWGGLVCGVLDIGSAFIDGAVTFNLGPVRLLQGVAGALLGPATFEGGLATAALGLVMHFSVAFTWTTIFYLLSRRFPGLLRHAWISGPAYGAVVFLVMYRVTIPLTIELKSLYLTTSFNHTWPKLRWSQFGVHLVSVGLAIALTVRRFSPAPAAKS